MLGKMKSFKDTLEEQRLAGIKPVKVKKGKVVALGKSEKKLGKKKGKKI